MSSNAAHFVGSIPEHYDKGLGPRIFEPYAADLSRRAAALAPAAVLELAAGTGIVTRALRDTLPADSTIVATDLSGAMLDWAQQKFGDDEAVAFETADALDLPFADAAFDALVCQFGVMFFPDKLTSYREARRVLKPGGSYLFNAWDSWEHNPFAAIADAVVGEFFPDDPPGFYRLPFGYTDTDAMHRDLAAAGFTDVTIEPVSFTATIPSSDDFAQGLVFGNPLFDEIRSRGGDPSAIRAALASALDERLGGRLALSATVVHATC